MQQKIQQEIHDQMSIGEKQSAENKLSMEREIQILKKEMSIECKEEFMKLLHRIDRQNEIQTAEVAKLRRELQQGLHHTEQASDAFAQNMKREAHEQNSQVRGESTHLGQQWQKSARGLANFVEARLAEIPKSRSQQGGPLAGGSDEKSRVQALEEKVRIQQQQMDLQREQSNRQDQQIAHLQSTMRQMQIQQHHQQQQQEQIPVQKVAQAEAKK